MPPEPTVRHPRLTPCRPDLAADFLEGKVVAPRFAAGRPVHVAAPVADVRRAPRPDAPLDTQALFGDAATCFDTDEGWAWVQLAADGYVGYVPAADLAPGHLAPTHEVAVLRTFVYPQPDMKMPPLFALPLGAACHVVAVAGVYAQLGGSGYGGYGYGYVHAAHLRARDGVPSVDFVACAERFIGMPYLWGGTSPLGLDCSGLVQTSLRLAGRLVPRDTDMQEASVGSAVPAGAPVRRGDLVFWAGHVGIMRDAIRCSMPTGITCWWRASPWRPPARGSTRAAAARSAPCDAFDRAVFLRPRSLVIRDLSTLCRWIGIAPRVPDDPPSKLDTIPAAVPRHPLTYSDSRTAWNGYWYCQMVQRGQGLRLHPAR